MFAHACRICHQHRQQQRRLCSLLLVAFQIFTFVTICAHLPQNVAGQIRYNGRLSEVRSKELQNIALKLEDSINAEQYACENYYDYVCSRNRPLYSILGSLPDFNDLIQLLKDLQDDPEQFEAKHKLMDFFISCNTVKTLEECYHQTFEYFKPMFGYIITKKYIDGSSNEFHDFQEVLDNFLTKAEHTEHFQRNPIRLKLALLREKFRMPQVYFHSGDINDDYKDLRIYRESYKHNLRNLEQYRKRNSTYEIGLQRTMLDWSLYVYQSRDKPMSYYFPTLSVHLWMTLYNSTERLRDPKRIHEMAECLKLPPYVHVLDEARVLAVIYLKSFRNAWQDYNDWTTATQKNRETFDQENKVLEEYHLNNKRLFFTLYAQNFCEFGKELAEHIFYLGLNENPDFFNIYSCSSSQLQRGLDCV